MPPRLFIFRAFFRAPFGATFTCRLTPLEEAALMIGSLAHDVGHPGLTNQYLINVRSPLAVTYNDISVLENYHASCCFRTAASPEFNVFHGLTKECFQYLRQHIIELILATDMKLHFDVISHLRVGLHGGAFQGERDAKRRRNGEHLFGSRAVQMSVFVCLPTTGAQRDADFQRVWQSARSLDFFQGLH